MATNLYHVDPACFALQRQKTVRKTFIDIYFEKWLVRDYDSSKERRAKGTFWSELLFGIETL